MDPYSSSRQCAQLGALSQPPSWSSQVGPSTPIAVHVTTRGHSPDEPSLQAHQNAIQRDPSDAARAAGSLRPNYQMSSRRAVRPPPAARLTRAGTPSHRRRHNIGPLAAHTDTRGRARHSTTRNTPGDRAVLQPTAHSPALTTPFLPPPGALPGRPAPYPRRPHPGRSDRPASPRPRTLPTQPGRRATVLDRICHSQRRRLAANRAC